MFRIRTHATRTAAFCLAASALALLSPATPAGVSPNIVISQVYGGGGNSGATLTNDFIELFNRGDAPVSVAGWSVQYASAAGTSWQVTPLSGTIPAGGYYLVQQAQGAGGTVSLPTPDAAGTITMAATNGKVALVSTTTTLSGTCPAGVIDFVGFGSTANCSETAPTPTLSNTTAALRAGDGCTDTDDNSADFSTAAPAPRNSAAPLNVCDGPPPPPTLRIDDVSVTEGNSGTVSATFSVSLNVAAPAGGVTFDITTADDSATTADLDYAGKFLTAQTIPAGQFSYAFEVAVNGDTGVEPNEAFLVNVTNVSGAAVGDAQGVGTIINDDFAAPVFDVVISQVYGAGGNSGATYTNDFVELFNRGDATVSLTGWSVQYASASGSSWQTTTLSGTIDPGQYYLVQQAAGSGGSVALPSSDAVGSIAMAAGSGKVALSSAATAFSGTCPSGALVDFLGYGGANCFEGAGAGPALSASLAAQRKRGGCFDSNDNATDFLATSPGPRNSASPVRRCEFLTLPIHAIQGTSLTSPYAGLDVTTTGIVTGVKNNGFFLQTPDGAADDDPATSQGLFVFVGGAPTTTAGDMVVVRGTAGEFFDLTQIESTLPGDVVVESTGHALPSPVSLTQAILDPAGTTTQLERFEGMRLHADALTSVAPTNGFGEIYTVLNGVTRPMREPGIERGAIQPVDPETGTLDCCVDVWDLNPERLMIDTDGLLGSSPLYVTSNVTLSGVSGPLDFTFGDYKVLPTAPPAVTPNLAAVPAPAAAPNEFSVAGYNIENYVGAEIQRRKAALNVRTVMHSPDVIGVVEIGSKAALQQLADEINGSAIAAGEPNPQYVAELIPFGTFSQHVGFLVKTSRVTINAVTQEQADEVFTNPATGTAESLHDRPPLVLDATVDPAGRNPGRILVVVNHLRSFIDVESTGDAGVRVRAKRKAQAEAVARLLQQLQETHATTPVIAVGDYNAYEFSDGYTDPMSVLRGQPTAGERIVVGASPDVVDPDFVNLTDTLPAHERYSFIFEGTPQALDHVLVNTVAQSYFQRYAIARSNADFPSHENAGLRNDPARPEVQSDHDAPVAYFAFPGTPVVTLNGSATMTVEAFTPFVDPGATANDDRGPLPVIVSGSVDVNVPGTYTLEYTASNVYATTTISRTVIVRDSIAPAISGFRVSPDRFWPPSHQLFDVAASYTATDASGTVACALSVTSNEPQDSTGDGNTAVDWIIVSPTLVRLRAEQAGTGTGRVYTVTVTCSDPSGNAATQSATVRISRQ
jgi:predicted extracellular nuclease